MRTPGRGTVAGERAWTTARSCKGRHASTLRFALIYAILGALQPLIRSANHLERDPARDPVVPLTTPPPGLRRAPTHPAPVARGQPPFAPVAGRRRRVHR